MPNNTYIILSEKSWNKEGFDTMSKKLPQYNWHLIDEKDDFTLENIKRINPTKIFIPHWSHIISNVIFEHYECIVFHMTDLPFGRGGSPLQNLIVLEHETTKISALKVEQEIDAGPIYLKKDLGLGGTAQDIFKNASEIINLMIEEIIVEKITPKPQNGDPTYFKRRSPEMSNIEDIDSTQKIYDYIRMLDAEGYPHAYIENEFFKFEFTKAKTLGNDIIEANVRIIKK